MTLLTSNLWSWANSDDQSKFYVGCHQFCPYIRLLVSCTSIQIGALAPEASEVEIWSATGHDYDIHNLD